jgi:Nucleotidyl transferase AbiEii toxin, Type IV TA system
VSEPSLSDKVLAIHVALSAAKVAHAFGGALALAYYAEPRATIDIDLNVFTAPSEYATVERALTPLGVAAIDPVAAQRDGQCRTWWGRSPIDLFFAYDELHEAMRRQARLVPFGEDRIPVLSPEHLLVCKSVFDRPKDWLDIEQVLIGTPDLDTEEIAQALDRLLGPEDHRTQRFAAAVGAVRDGGS